MHEPALTVEAFPEEVRAVVGVVAGVTVPRPGYTSSVVLVEGRHGAVAVKRARDARFGDWLAREYAVLQALASSRLPVPAPLAFLRRETTAGPESWLVM